MKKIPCENCICYAICKASKTIVPLVVKCELLTSYIQSIDDVYEIIKFIQPGYYVQGTSLSDLKKKGYLRENIYKIFKAVNNKKAKEILNET